MKRLPVLPGLLAAFVLMFTGAAQAESHRATRLGNPATRFAPSLTTPDDLRALFRNEKLRPDFAAILSQWGWQGQLDDLFAAAATAEISDISIPVGTTMPFMSSRENGRPICLRNVLWAGREPAPAYAFHFTSAGRRYRCMTPKACSNFFLEDLGPEPKSALALDCIAPAEVLAGRPVTVCLNVRQTGNVADSRIAVTLSLPEGATVTRTTGGGISESDRVTWEILELAPGGARQVCAVLAARQPGLLPFTATADGASAKPAQTACATKIIGVPAILLEVVDLEDPIEVGDPVTYEIKVTNQGTATGTNIRLVCTLPDSQSFVSGSGTTAVEAQDNTVTMATVPALAPKAAASWRVVVKAMQPADARFKVALASDQFPQPITEDESTQQY